MNEAFDTFLTLSDQERRDVFDASAERLDTLATYIEKDFWVCRVLDALYHGRPGYCRPGGKAQHPVGLTSMQPT